LSAPFVMWVTDLYQAAPMKKQTLHSATAMTIERSRTLRQI